MTARFFVSVALEAAQVTANPDDDTAVGVKVMMLVRIPFVLLVKLTANPISVILAPNGSNERNVAPIPSKTPVLFVLHLSCPLEVQVHILCSSSPGHTTRLSHSRVTAA